MNPSEIFQQRKYIYLSNFLDKENCNQYVQEFQKLIQQGISKKDEQCPLSHSLGHTPLFDSLLEQLTPNMETATGKKLYPTYAYARWYAPGDELKIHKDRPACEISATITLGFEGGQWPIYVGNNSDKSDARQINMNVGDAVVYKGCELYHWREKYIEGQWQAQVFLHYVDANGPHAQEKYDRRNKLAHHDNESTNDQIQKEEGYFFVMKGAFNSNSCQRIIKSFESNKDSFVDAPLVGNVVDKKIRNTSIIRTNSFRGVGAALTGMGLAANYQNWKFDITHSNQCEFLKYDPSGHFNLHIDTILNEKTNETRKLTVILFLNDDFEGGKLYLQYGKEKVYPSQNAGDVIVFPSFLLHSVEPIISGIRRSIVTWLVGPYFK